MQQDTEQGHLSSCGDVSGLFRGGEGSVEILKLEGITQKKSGGRGRGQLIHQREEVG